MKRKKSLVKVLCLITALMMLFFVAACDDSDDDAPIVTGPVNDSTTVTKTINAGDTVNTFGDDMQDVQTDIVVSIPAGTQAILEDQALSDMFPLDIQLEVSDPGSEATFENADFDIKLSDGTDVEFDSLGHVKVVSIQDANGDGVIGLTQPVTIVIYFQDGLVNPLTGGGLAAGDTVQIWSWQDESPIALKSVAVVKADADGRLYAPVVVNSYAATIAQARAMSAAAQAALLDVGTIPGLGVAAAVAKEKGTGVPVTGGSGGTI